MVAVTWEFGQRRTTLYELTGRYRAPCTVEVDDAEPSIPAVLRFRILPQNLESPRLRFRH